MSEQARSESSEGPRLSLLIVDDNTVDRETYRRLLENDPTTRYAIVEAESGEEALARARENVFDCVLLADPLPDADGLEVLSQLVRDPWAPAIPVIVLTSGGSASLAVETMKRGSEDYLTKGELTQTNLWQAVRNAVEKVALRHALGRKPAALDSVRKEQLALKDRFLSHVSHELRTPLAAIDQFLSLVLDGIAGEINDEQREYLGHAARNVGQLTKLISDLMDAVRAQSKKLRIEIRKVSLVELLCCTRLAHEASAEANGIELRMTAAPDLPTVLADGPRIEQVLNNLVENAIKFTPEGGSVDLHVEVDPEDRGFVRTSVADSGCGMKEEDAARIFDRLYQAGGEQVASRTGLGLGLSICKELIERQNGRIWVESKPGVGSTFRFTLPVLSMQDLVRSALLDDTGRLRKACALVRIRLVPSDGGRRRISDSETRRLHRSVAGLVNHPVIDVLLPRLLFAERGDVLFVVAGTHGAGLDAMIARLTRYLNQSEEGGSSGVQVEIDGQLIPIRPPEGETTLEGALADAAQRIESIIANERNG